MRASVVVTTLAVSLGCISGIPDTGASPARPVYTKDGLVHVPAFDLPPSTYMSKEAVDLLKMRSAMTGEPPGSPPATIEEIRRATEMQLAPFVEVMSSRYPANVVQDTIAGVPVRVFTPKHGKVDKERVLINLHGGAFMMCADGCSMLESLPISSIGGFKVVSVNYRMAPEATFPAASEDVSAVYQELLKSYSPNRIGIYGCSAGGNLSAQVAAWLPTRGLPRPGAIGIFGAGAVPFQTGDSAYVAAYIDGAFPPPPSPDSPPPPQPIRSYFDGADMHDPLISPAEHLRVLAKFPPTLLITGTRAIDMSPAVYTHSQLVKTGVDSNLIVGEGMAHCYMYFPQFPESQDAYRTITRFFKKNLR